MDVWSRHPERGEGKRVVMNCSQVRRDVALWVGQDLDDVSRRIEIRRHLANCPDCHRHFRQMKHTLQVLEKADREPTFRAGDSLWPAVANRIAQPHPVASPNRFNGWAPFVAMTAACLVLMLAVNDRPGQQSPVMRGPSAMTFPIPMLEPISVRNDLSQRRTNRLPQAAIDDEKTQPTRLEWLDGRFE